MLEWLLSFVVWWSPILLAMALLSSRSGVSVNWRWLLFAVAVYAWYVTAIVIGMQLDLLTGWLPDVQYNWDGKILAIAVTLIIMAIVVRFSDLDWRDLGVTLRQNAGSVVPAVIATGIMIGLMVILQLLAADGRQMDAETLIYQALIPGLDEELFYRGLLLGLMVAAIRHRRWQWLGAEVGWAAIFVTLLFALGHSVFLGQEGLQFDPVILVYTLILGGLLMWIRLRTGSVLIPIIAHNLTNLTGKLF